jgi:hypothetical protein
MRHPCRMVGGKRPVSRPPLRERIKAEFGYDDRKGVGACDRGPSWQGDAKEGRGRRPVSRVAGKAGWAGFGYDSRKGVGACDRGPSGLFRKFVAPFLHCI